VYGNPQILLGDPGKLQFNQQAFHTTVDINLRSPARTFVPIEWQTP
jgi:hypothetical protein